MKSMTAAAEVALLFISLAATDQPDRALLRIGCPFECCRAPGNYSLGVIRVALIHRWAGPERGSAAKNDCAANNGHDNAMPLVIVHLIHLIIFWRCFSRTARSPATISVRVDHRRPAEYGTVRSATSRELSRCIAGAYAANKRLISRFVTEFEPRPSQGLYS